METINTASTTGAMDNLTCAILDTMQKEDENLTQQIVLLKRCITDIRRTRTKEIELLRKAIAEMNLEIRRQETIREATSGNCQDSLVPNSLNKSLEKKDVTVENEEMVLKEFSKELQSNVENSYEKKISIDNDSQDYIFIKTGLMFGTNSLTKHFTKEIFLLLLFFSFIYLYSQFVQ